MYTTVKTCLKCGRTIENKEIAHEVVNQNWTRLGYVCDDCIDTYPREDIKDPDVEGEVIIDKPQYEIITLEEARLRKVESILLAVCDLVVNCMGDAHFYCDTQKCKDDLYGTGCPFGQMRDFRDDMNDLRKTWGGQS